MRVEGFAIILEDGMLGDANGRMPSALVIEADQKYLSDGLDAPTCSFTDATRMKISPNPHIDDG